MKKIEDGTFIFSLVNEVNVSIVGSRYGIKLGVRKNESVIDTNGNDKYFTCNLSKRFSSFSSLIIDGELINKIIESKGISLHNAFN